MTMNYQKITIPIFRERLKDDLYKTITAARRAIGKADWNQEVRDQAHTIANRHFSAAKVITKAPSSVKASVEKAKPQSRPQATVLSRKSLLPSPNVSTNAEIIEICGVLHTFYEALRKASESVVDGAGLSKSESAQAMREVTTMVIDSMRVLHAALRKAAPEPVEIVEPNLDRKRNAFTQAPGKKAHMRSHIAVNNGDTRVAASG